MVGLGIVAVLLIAVGGMWYIAQSASAGLARTASRIPELLVAIDNRSSHPLADSSRVMLGGRRVATLYSRRIFAGGQHGTDGITVYSGTWDLFEGSFRGDTTLAAQLVFEGDSVAPTVIHLVQRRAGIATRLRGALWLDPAPGAYLLY
jgi:hypothetical protein